MEEEKKQKTKKKYLRSCSIAILEDNAIDRGYTPCSRCNP